MADLQRATSIASSRGRDYTKNGIPIGYEPGMFVLNLTIGFRTERDMENALRGVEELFSCGWCKGKGKISATFYADNVNYGAVEMPCKFCNGKGFIDDHSQR